MVLINEKGQGWVGISLCSPSDAYSHKTGKAKAFGRAIKAMLKRAGSPDLNLEPPLIEPEYGTADLEYMKAQKFAREKTVLWAAKNAVDYAKTQQKYRSDVAKGGAIICLRYTP